MKKIRDRSGFTLAETLLAVLILLMVSVITATGMPAARNAYEKVVLASDAEILLSTAMSELRNELGTAKNLDIPNGTTSGKTKTGQEINFLDNNTGSDSGIYLDSSNGVNTIMVRKTGRQPRRLVTEEASTADLYLGYSEIEFNTETGVITFKGLAVMRTSNNAVLTQLDAFSIRAFSDR